MALRQAIAIRHTQPRSATYGGAEPDVALPAVPSNRVTMYCGAPNFALKPNTHAPLRERTLAGWAETAGWVELSLLRILPRRLTANIKSEPCLATGV
jgi:hypothetical protein